eukprot:358514-Chlamydomonas_euryale.AAC.11
MQLVPECIAVLGDVAAAAADAFAEVRCEDDVRVGAALANKLLKTAKKVASELMRDPCDALAEAQLDAWSHALGVHAAAAAGAAGDAGAALADAQLCAASLSPDSFVHLTTARSKALLAAWRHMAELASAVGRAFPGRKLQLQRQAMRNLLLAAGHAAEMLDEGMPGGPAGGASSGGDDDDGDDAAAARDASPGLMGAWGAPASGATGGLVGSSAVVFRDEDVQVRVSKARAWSRVLGRCVVEGVGGTCMVEGVGQVCGRGCQAGVWSRVSAARAWSRVSGRLRDTCEPPWGW